MNHLEFFGLQEDPFRITPDRNFFFPTRKHTALREVIRYGLEEGEGFIIITGEVGTGKTLMLRLMMDDLPDRFETALILSPHLSRHELLLAILQDIGLARPQGGNPSLDSLLRVLNDHLFAISQQGKRLVIVIDEAQNLPDESLEQLRLLSNFETDTQKLLQIVLFGQPELHDKLAQTNMRQLVQRMTIMEYLAPLTKQEMVDYILYRFGKGGVHGIKLPRPVIKLLWQFTSGYPRLINKVMSRALLVAYAARQPRLSRKIVQEAIASLSFRNRIRRRSVLSAISSAAARLLLLGALLGLLAGLLFLTAPQLARYRDLLPAGIRSVIESWTPARTGPGPAALPASAVSPAESGETAIPSMDRLNETSDNPARDTVDVEKIEENEDTGGEPSREFLSHQEQHH